ncbi:hypothetical protein [Streptomyces coffeae]|uniref:hypothetical protein n=1 Tax=Streptomyces coffeae TaxID=621382 RepID=UPI001F3A77D8|nr:hypothetical protein [Streptomyces coffeae]
MRSGLGHAVEVLELHPAAARFANTLMAMHDGRIVANGRHIVVTGLDGRAHRARGIRGAPFSGGTTPAARSTANGSTSADPLAPRTVPMDLRPYGGPEDGAILDGAVQEVDLATGRLVFSC